MDSEGSGIGTGDEGKFTGTVTIGGNAAVVAAGSDEGCGIGASDGEIYERHHHHSGSCKGHCLRRRSAAQPSVQRMNGI